MPNYNKLYLAARNGDLDMVKKLVAKGVDIDAANAKGETPLWAAAHNYTKRMWDVVAYLIDQGANIDALPTAGPDKSTSIVFLAAKAGELEIVKKLVARGADINAANADGKTPLWAAAQYVALTRSSMNCGVVEYLIDQGADIDALPTAGPDKSTSIVFLAAKAGELEIVKKLVARDADINAANADGATPLWAAAYCAGILHDSRAWNLVEYLIDQDAKIDVLPNVGAEQSPIVLLAAKAGELGIVKKLIARGADINAANSKGRTAIMSATIADDIQMAKLLLLKGATFNIQEEQAWTDALAEATRDNTNNKCVKYIKEIYERRIILELAKLSRLGLPQSNRNKQKTTLSVVTSSLLGEIQHMLTGQPRQDPPPTDDKKLKH